jgi:hypothetical protein
MDMKTRTSAAWALASVLLLVCSAASPASAQVAPTERDDDAALAERRAAGNTVWVTGLAVLTSTWVITGAVGTTLVEIANARPMTIAESWIPVAGPWILCADSRGFTESQLALAIVSGVVQALGAVAFVTGLVLENEGPSTRAGAARLWLAPTANRDGAGLHLAGTF